MSDDTTDLRTDEPEVLNIVPSATPDVDEEAAGHRDYYLNSDNAQTSPIIRESPEGYSLLIGGSVIFLSKEMAEEIARVILNK